MNMTDNDKELALRIARDNGIVPMYISESGPVFESLLYVIHRYHTAKLEQAAKSHLLGGDLDVFSSRFPKTADRIREELSKAASQQPAIAALTEELADLRQSSDLRHEADMRAVAMWREKTGKELTMPDHADLVCWMAEEVERLKLERDTAWDDGHIAGREKASNAKELQSAQLDNKRLREQRYELMGIAADVDAGKGFDVVCRRTLQRVIDNLSAPIDTSAADELLTRVSIAVDCLSRINSASVSLPTFEIVKEGDEEASTDNVVIAIIAARDQLAAAHSAMEKAISFCEDGIHMDQAWYVQEAIDILTRALGEEQKKEGGV